MSQIKEILVLHHSHLDVGYTHPQPVLWELQRDYIDQAIELCERTADLPEERKFRWTCEATAPVLHWLRSASDCQVARFQQLLSTHQMGIAAMNMHTAPLCDAEQMAQMLYPVRELRERFGIVLNTAINHDINGQPWPMSQILLDAGVEFYITGINCHFGGIPIERPRLFHWQTPDDRQLLTFHGEHYSMFTQIGKTWENSTDVLAEGLAEYTQRIVNGGYPYDFVYLTATNIPMFDNTPPDTELLNLINRWNQEDREYKIRLVTPELFLERVRQINPQEVPTYAGDWTDYWNFGSASSATETRLNRRTKQTMRSVELLQAFQPVTEHESEIKQQARRHINLYDEHTWGASASVTQPKSIHTIAQWTHKSNDAFQGNSLTSYLFGRQMESFANNDLQSEGLEGVLLVNPTPVSQVVDLRIPEDYFAKGRHLSANRYRFHARNEDTAGETASYGTLTVEPFSWTKVPLSHVVKAEPSKQIQVTQGQIDTPYYTMQFNSETGRVTSLYDKHLNWEVLDTSSPWTLFEFVRETVDPLRGVEHRRALYDRDIDKCNRSESCWNQDWPARRVGAERMKSCKVETHPTSVSLVTTWSAPGVKGLELKMTFFSYRPGVEFIATFDKEDILEPESIYFAIPLNLQSWRAKYDTADMFVELDKEQLPGSCRDWVTVGQTVSVFDDGRGVTLACPDAPMVQVGGFNFGRESKSLSKDPNPLLLAWPVNNYWDTNFRASQPGPITVKYELSTFEQFNALDAVAAGVNAMQPVEMWPVVSCSDLQSGAFLSVEGDGIAVTYVKPAEDWAGIIVRLRNHSNQPTVATIRTPGRALKSANLLNHVEHPVKSLSLMDEMVSVPVAANGFVTVGLYTDNE